MPLAGPIAKLEMAQYFLNVLIAQIVLFRSFKKDNSHFNNQIKYLMFATILGFFGAAGKLFTMVLCPIPAYF